jgi:hypothetical protein
LKKIYLLFPACILAVLQVTAQEPFRPSTSIGITGGAGISYVNFKPFIRQDILTSYSTGIIFRHVSEPNIGVQFEVISAGKGWIENRDSAGAYERRIDVIDFPFTAVFIAGKKTLRLSFEVGPYVSYRRGEKETVNIVNALYFREYYGKPLENKLEGGFIAGLGVEVHTHAGVFALRGTFSHALTNLFPLNAPEFYYQGSRMMNLNSSFYYMITF